MFVSHLPPSQRLFALQKDCLDRTISALPKEIWQIILNNLTFKEVALFAQTCKIAFNNSVSILNAPKIKFTRVLVSIFKKKVQTKLVKSPSLLSCNALGTKLEFVGTRFSGRNHYFIDTDKNKLFIWNPSANQKKIFDPSEHLNASKGDQPKRRRSIYTIKQCLFFSEGFLLIFQEHILIYWDNDETPRILKLKNKPGIRVCFHKGVVLQSNLYLKVSFFGEQDFALGFKTHYYKSALVKNEQNDLEEIRLDTLNEEFLRTGDYTQGHDQSERWAVSYSTLSASLSIFDKHRQTSKQIKTTIANSGYASPRAIFQLNFCFLGDILLLFETDPTQSPVVASTNIRYQAIYLPTGKSLIGPTQHEESDPTVKKPSAQWSWSSTKTFSLHAEGSIPLGFFTKATNEGDMTLCYIGHEGTTIHEYSILFEKH